VVDLIKRETGVGIKVVMSIMMITGMGEVEGVEEVEVEEGEGEVRVEVEEGEVEVDDDFVRSCRVFMEFMGLEFERDYIRACPPTI
jgi:hypothetical protein